MIQERNQTPTEKLLAEIAGASEKCQYTCKHMSPEGISCTRATNHEGASIMVDLHVYLLDGVPITFDETCCEENTS